VWLVAALLSLLATYAACLRLTRALARQPASLAALIAAAVLVNLEALLVHALSAVRALDAAGLLAGNTVIAASAVAIARGRPGRPLGLRRLSWAGRGWLFGAIAALGLLALISALAYRPNNWDSMTYHLARVAYWLQNRSVAPYATNIARQVDLPPGAEYLVLVLQAISGTERLASLVQFGAWMLLVLSAPALARTHGAPRTVSRWAAVLAATIPMAVLQASSTQNDLLAAVIAIAVIAASRPFQHSACRRWRRTDVGLLFVSIAAGLLVKPTSLVAAAPFVLWGLFATLQGLHRYDRWREAARAWPALALVIAAIGPAASATLTSSPTKTPFVYQVTDSLGDRLTNSVVGIARNVPATPDLLEWLSTPTKIPGCPNDASRCLEWNRSFHEDVAANPGHTIVVAAAMVLAAVRWHVLSSRSRVAILCLPCAWVIFHALFRDNPWITRLELPLFAVSPVSLAAANRLRQSPSIARVMTVGAGILLVYGGIAAIQNVRRPVDPPMLARGQDPAAYYIAGPPGVAMAHDAALTEVARSTCRRLGLYIGADSYDYPLTWRAMQQGFEVRHVVGPDDWPCAIFTDRGPPPSHPALRWEPTDLPFLYIGRAATSASP
jgi:hypothetical protein